MEAIAIDIYLEAGETKVFASAVDWPGWSRSGKTEDDAIAILLAYAPRFAQVTKLARVSFSPPKTTRGLRVVARLRGGSGTDFGVPSVFAPRDDDLLPPAELERWRSLLQAAWKTWDSAAATAKGVKLSVGPRGGGRHLEKMADHVREAEESYLVSLGVKRPKDVTLNEIHTFALKAFDIRARGKPLADPNRVSKPWSPRYYARRSAWHALDHAWEVEDRSRAS